MAYDRYDRDDRRWQNERPDRDWRGDQRGQNHLRDDRGFLERAGDEISSWFGSGRDDDRGRDRDRASGRWSSSDRPSLRGPERDYRDRDPRSDRELNRDRALLTSGGSTQRDWDHERRDERERSDRGYRPMTGDYGRARDHDHGAQKHHPGEFHSESDRSEGPSSRDDYRRTRFAGSRKDQGDHDPNYRDWRQRHMSDIDRDYHDYHRERQLRFEDDFSDWRNKRQEKRGLLSRIRENMEVLGNDGQHLGTVDTVAGDRIILNKSDTTSGGRHHSIICSWVDRVDENRVILDCAARDARNRWRDEDRSRALFERHDQGEAGPGVLNRSFSGTYRDR